MRVILCTPRRSEPMGGRCQFSTRKCLLRKLCKMQMAWGEGVGWSRAGQEEVFK